MRLCTHATPAGSNGYHCAKFQQERHAGVCRICKANDGEDFPPAAKPWTRAGSVKLLPPAPPAPLPREQWPAKVKAVAFFRDASDVGVGDTIKRVLGQPGEAYKAAMAAAGIPCGCTDRQKWLNARFPYPERE